MPGTIPLGDPRVLDEVCTYLEDSWKSIIDADVDGPTATPTEVDQQNLALFGHKAVTRRLARTVFLGSAATLRSAHKGIDQNRIWLGTAVPGDGLPHFSTALHRLADQATYLYSDAARYWYDTQASVTRIAKDQADRLREQPDEVDAEIVRRLRAFERRSTGDFSATRPVAPESSADIADTDEARLIILHPRHVHRSREAKDTPAVVFAREVLSSRGNIPRRHRNMVVFLAADERRKEELGEAVREYLSWGHVREHARDLDLSPTQLQMATTRRERADEVIDQRISTTYHWVLLPEQPDPTAPAVVRPMKVEGQPELAVRVSDRLRREGALAAVHAPQNIRQYLDGPLAPLWNSRHLSVGQLWQHYTAHPYLPRLRDRAVLDDAILAVLSAVTWEIDGFALATGYDENEGRYTGLVLPHQGTLGVVTDDVLLVNPAIADRQRREERLTDSASDGGGDEEITTTEIGDGTWSLASGTEARPSSEQKPTSFVGRVTVDPERYGREFTRLQQEIIAHLAAVEGGTLQITVELRAHQPEGFSQSTVRTISENADVLRFEQADFG